jgi:hypothetical protein
VYEEYSVLKIRHLGYEFPNAKFSCQQATPIDYANLLFWVRPLFLYHTHSSSSASLLLQPITVAAPSKALTVFDHSNDAIVGSNPTQGMDVCVRLFCVCVGLRVGSGLATG